MMPVCRHCGSENLVRRGYSNVGKVKVQCKECNSYSMVEDDDADPSPHIHRSARILLLDIETSLMKFYGFRPKTEYIPHELMIADWSVLCWGAKWLFEPTIMGETVTPKESMAREDKRILGGMWSLINEADIIVTQNGIQFDLKKLNSRFLLNGFNPPSKYMNVDTLKVS